MSEATAIADAPAEQHAREVKSAPAHHGSHGDGFLMAVQSVLMVLVVALFTMTFLLQPYRIPSESMVPTLKVGDFLLVNKQSYAPRSWADFLMPPSPVRRGDVVVFHYPVNGKVHVVKRVVGLPGDRLRLRDGRLYVNGNPASEPYAYYSLAIPDAFRDQFPSLHGMDANVDPNWWRTLRRDVRDGELTVPPDRFFVMGDNRNDSEDSRYWGFVPRTGIVGRPFVVYFSMDDQGSRGSLFERLARVVHGAHRVR